METFVPNVEEAMQSYTMASAHDCPPAVLLMTESRAELNAGLVIVTGHVPAIYLRCKGG